jgi:DNA-binding MurR/RpiR family transcriptional regulator
MAKESAQKSVESRSLAERIRRDIDHFTVSEKRAAHLLLSHYPFAGLGTVAEFATRAGISAPSVLRFVTRLGFGGFPEFQKSLRDELEAQLKSPLAKAQGAQSPGAGAGGSALTDFAEASIDNLRATIASVPPGEFDAVAALIGDPKRRIHFAGGRFTEALARYAERHLRIVRGDVGFLESQPSLWRDRMVEIGRRDVVVVFDIRRYQPDTIALAETASGQGATVVLMTDRWLSPIARVARHILPAHVEVPSNWDSSLALLLIVEALIAAVTKDLWASARPRMEAIERLRSDEQP